MKRAARIRGLLAGCALVAAAGCAETDGIETIQSEITGNWVSLGLGQWQNYNGTANAPAVGKVNGVVTFRGALKGLSATSNFLFQLPPGYRTINPTLLELRTVTAGRTGGTLFIDYSNNVYIYEDDPMVSKNPGSAPGQNAKIFTSLDGVSFDETSSDATVLVETQTPDYNWAGEYGHRSQGIPPERAASAKIVGGFVRFQGWLRKTNTGDPNATFLFQLPSTPTNYRPTHDVYVPIALCGGGAHQAYGRLNIYGGSGYVYVQPENGNMAAANCSVSLEGTSFAFSPTSQTLNLQTGWTPYNQRPVRVRISNGVVRFQGSVYNGNYPQIAIGLPTSMRPPVDVYMQADAYGATRARITVSPQGVVTVDAPILPISQDFTSLDGVSFGL